ncbi:MAG TPA: patatin-like phospholipase family protein [Polyangiaceae bacterium]|nr:patatin-like phospholipase family protein [Polyangiaceae bacterium]
MPSAASAGGPGVALRRAPGDDSPRRSLVLAGGGMRVAYQAGVLRALEEAGLTFDHADGTSGGTMNLAMLLSGLSPAQMCERWRSLRVGDFVSFMPVAEYLRGDGALALGDADGIVEHVFPHLGIDVERIRAAKGLMGTFNVCNFGTKTNRAVPNGEIELGLLVAGISLPAFMPPVRVGGDDYVDSVWIKDANLLEAVRRGAEDIWLVWCIGNCARYRRGAFNQYVHMIEISANGALFAELEQIADLNRRIAAGGPLGDAASGRRRPIRVKVIAPEYPLPLDSSYYLGQIDGATLVAQGYADAWRRLSRRDVDDALSEQATRMRTPESTLAWRDRSRGRLEGAGGAGAQLELDLSVFVYELAPFLADVEHRAPLVGSIAVDGGPLSLLRDASFRCVHDPDTHERRWIHEASFLDARTARWRHLIVERRSAAASRTLAGDLSTLFVQIRDGAGADALVVSEGVLRTSPKDVKDLCCSLRAIEPDSPAAALGACQRLGRLLFDEFYAASTRPWWKFW